MSDYSSSIQSILVNSANITREQDRSRKNTDAIKEKSSEEIQDAQRIKEETVVETREQNDPTRVKDDEERPVVSKGKKKDEEQKKSALIKDDKLGSILDISC